MTIQNTENQLQWPDDIDHINSDIVIATAYKSLAGDLREIKELLKEYLGKA